MPCSLVAVHQTLADGMVDGGNGHLVGGFRSALVPGFYRGNHFLDARAHEGPLAGIAQTVFFRLTGTLAC